MRTCRWIAALALLVGTACGGSGGGGGGGGGVTNLLYSGSYFTAAIGGMATGGSPFAQCLAGPVVAAGDGTSTWNVQFTNNDGLVAAGSPILGSYSAASTGALNQTFGTTVLNGALATAGDATLFSRDAPGVEPYFGIGVKPVGTFSAASLSGAYHFGYVAASGVASQLSAVSRISFDGVGTWSFTSGISGNTSGTVTTGGAVPGGTYAVASDGRVTFAGGTGSLSGAMIAGGGFVLLAGDTAGPFGPRMVLLVRAGSGLSGSTFFGNYWVAGISFEAPAFPGPPPPYRQFTTFHGDVFANGGGLLAYGTLTRNTEGVISTVSLPDTYTALSDGTLLTTDVGGGSGGPFRRGGISPDGRFAFVAGSIVNGSPPLLYFFLKK